MEYSDFVDVDRESMVWYARKHRKKAGGVEVKIEPVKNWMGFQKFITNPDDLVKHYEYTFTSTV